MTHFDGFTWAVAGRHAGGETFKDEGAPFNSGYMSIPFLDSDSMMKMGSIQEINKVRAWVINASRTVRVSQQRIRLWPFHPLSFEWD